MTYKLLERFDGTVGNQHEDDKVAGQETKDVLDHVAREILKQNTDLRDLVYLLTAVVMDLEERTIWWHVRVTFNRLLQSAKTVIVKVL